MKLGTTQRVMFIYAWLDYIHYFPISILYSTLIYYICLLPPFSSMHYIHLVSLFKENNSVATFNDLMTEPNIEACRVRVCESECIMNCVKIVLNVLRNVR